MGDGRNMSIRIEAGAIVETNSVGQGRYKRLIVVSDFNIILLQQTIFADEKDELYIIDNER